MELLNKTISYWYDCIKHEDILGKDISTGTISESKALLYPFDTDPFVFNSSENLVTILKNDKLNKFLEYISTQGHELYYGYPILIYFDDISKKCLIAPLFIIKLQIIDENNQLYLQKDEQIPTCGIQAFTKLGLRTEEIAILNQSLEKLFLSNFLDIDDMAQKCLDLINKEIDLPYKEPIDPKNLTNSKTISKNITPGLYNKSLIFAGEKTGYNMYLLQDLSELKDKTDLDKTALSFILGKHQLNEGVNKIPILPFPSNEYQVKALQDIFQNNLSVITGPPGTGKSQFISNLLINLFLEGKSVLFVSHTNEAVDVVYKKINEQFQNLMLRTGNKEFRQELKGKFHELQLVYSKTKSKDASMDEIQSKWQMILEQRNKLLELEQLQQKFEDYYLYYKDKKSFFYNNTNLNLEESFEELLPNLVKIKIFKTKLDNLKNKIDDIQPNFSITLFLLQKYLKIKKRKWFSSLNSILPRRTLTILQNSQQTVAIKDWEDPGWVRLKEYLELLEYHKKLEEIKRKLDTFPPRIVIEQEIQRLENSLYNASTNFVKNIYIKKILGSGENTGNVNSFLQHVDSRQQNDNGIDNDLFKKALSALKIWSSTLKSIRRNFPLSPGIFDYVIFDEASQVDLPSAAPALYRAKRAIVVGDPKQLCHIASITYEKDKELAKFNNLTEYKDIYPSKIRYRDVSLYKAAENSLNHTPIMLIHHYRSEYQIFDLCNKVFYKGSLRIMTDLNYSQYPDSLPRGVHWINCNGEAIKSKIGGRINKEEAKCVYETFKEVLQRISDTNLSVGIVTPYTSQQDEIFKLISNSSSISKELLKKHNVEILTAHKFQGSEKDIMIFSLVLASHGNGNSEQWYNNYPQILNVALSRAKYLLYIIGDQNFCLNRPSSSVLKQLAITYKEIKKQEDLEENILKANFDSPTEYFLYQKLQDVDFLNYGYKLIPKLVVKGYTLDFALCGKKKIDIECDGCQHEIIGGLPVLEDVKRDKILKKEGWVVLRFPNFEILSQTDKVIEQILENL